MTTGLHRFNGRVVLITGAGAGIGRGIALRFAREGADIAIVEKSAVSAKAVAAEVRGLKRKALPVVGDATDEALIARSLALAERELCPIDVLVNNVGLAKVKPLMQTESEEWDRMLDINVKAAFMWSREVARKMLATGHRGCIVNIASDCGKVGDPYSGVYVAAKHAVIGLTKNLAHELAPQGIRVNAVCPGWIDTALLAAYNEQVSKLEKRSVESIREETLTKIPLRRLGTPDDVAGLVSFLASDDAGYMTGQSINVTGGAVMF